jgi:uncharacterized membrane protein
LAAPGTARPTRIATQRRVKQEAAHLRRRGFIRYATGAGAAWPGRSRRKTEEGDMSDSGSVIDAHEEKTSTAKVIYILYVVGWAIPIIAQIVGVIFAYVNREDAPAWLRTHYQLQIRTFWIGLLFAVISLVTTMFYIGYLLMLLTLIWMTIRCAKGLKAIFDGEPYENPETWLW